MIRQFIIYIFLIIGGGLAGVLLALYGPGSATATLRLTPEATFPATLKPVADPLNLQKMRAQLPTSGRVLQLQLEHLSGNKLLLVGRTPEAPDLEEKLQKALRQWEQNLRSALQRPLRNTIQTTEAKLTELNKEKTNLTAAQAALAAQPLNRQQTQRMNIIREDLRQLNARIVTQRQQAVEARQALQAIPQSFFMIENMNTQQHAGQPDLYTATLYGMGLGGAVVFFLLLSRLTHHNRRLTEPAQISALTGLPVLGNPWPVGRHKAEPPPPSLQHMIRTSTPQPVLAAVQGVNKRTLKKISGILDLQQGNNEENAPVILVVYLNKTKPQSLVNTVETINQTGQDILGVVQLTE